MVINMQIITNLFNKYGLLFVFFLILLEYACFPLPSEVVLPFVGFVASMNGYSIIGVILLSTIMGYLGCLTCYLVGYYGGSYLYKKIYDRFQKWQKGMDMAMTKFNKYGNLSVFICRLIPLCRTYISFLAGLFKQNLFKYSLYSILGILIWNTVLITLGYVLVDNWGLVEIYYNKYRFIILFLGLLIICLFLVYKLYKKKKLTKTISGD